LTRVIADAVAEGLVAKHSKPEESEPLAAWEQELLSADAAAPAVAEEAAPAAEVAAPAEKDAE
jgi:small subunit ribosomal protein S2